MVAAPLAFRDRDAGGRAAPSVAARAAGTLKAGITTTVAAQCGVFPIILAMDGRISLVAPLVNLVAVPASGLVVPLGLVFPVVEAVTHTEVAWWARACGSSRAWSR